jgi:hypothetical protein
MSLDIEITSTLLDAAKMFDGIDPREVGKAARRSINRTLLTLRKESVQRIPEHLKIKAKTLRDRYIRLNKAQGGNNYEGSIDFSSEPIPMIEFVKGSKEPIKQKGVKVSRRRKLKVEITPGKRFVLRKGFIQRVLSKQVFKRPAGKDNFKKQGVPSVGTIVIQRGIGKDLVDIGAARFSELFVADLNARLKGFVPSDRFTKP